jgi:hypothetical protein
MSVFVLRLDILPECKPADEWAVIESASHKTATNFARERWSDIDDAILLCEIPEDQRWKIPRQLICQRISAPVAERLMLDCGIVEDHWWLEVPPLNPDPKALAKFEATFWKAQKFRKKCHVGGRFRPLIIARQKSN